MKVKYFSRIVDNVNTLTRVYIPAAVILLLFFYTGGSVFAQGISQVTITGIPPIISSPNISDLEGNFNNGMYSIQFTYTNSNPGQVPFVFHVVLEKDGKTLIDVKSDPKNYSPGTYLLSSLFNDLNFPYSFSDLLNQVGSALKQQVIQGGVIPEGNYTIKIEALPANAAQGVSAVPAIVNAQVIYPQPPILVTPADESNVIQNIPTFSWTPVVVPGGTSIEYDLLLVQVIDSQTPLQAINSNRAYAEVKLINQNTYSYTPDNLPLQKGQKYAWQITAKDANGIIPFKDDGRSEIYTFTYGKSENGNEQAGGIKNLKSITLVPGFAELINLKNLEAQDNDSYYSLNGYASLLFHLPGLSKSESTVQVNVNNLMLQKGSPGHPVLMGGQVSGDALPPLKIFEKFKGLVNVSGFQWNFGQGFTIESSFFDSDGNPLQAAGNLNLTAQGIRGHLNFSQPLTFSSSGKGSSVKYEAESIDFGKGTLSGSGSLWLNLGGRSFKCGTCGFTLNPEVQGNGPIFVINVNSGNTVSIPLVKGSKNLLLDLTNPHGKVSYNFTSKKFADDLNFVGLIKLHLMSGVTCCLTAGVGFNSQKGFSVKDAVPTCKITNPRIDLGAVKMELRKFSLSKLSYNTSDGKWDFKLNFDAVLDPAIFPGISLPEVKDITLTPGGFDFPSINFSESALSNLPAIFYPPQQGYYPPQQGYYPPQQGYYPPQQGVLSSSTGAYPPQQGYYPPQQGYYPPQQGYYPPQQGYSGQQEFSSLEHPTVVNPFSTSLGLKSFDMKGFTFPWFNWERNNAGSWDFKLDLSIGFPKVNSGLLSCFNNKKINISGVRFSNGKMDINLNASRLKNCIMPLGEGSKIIVSKLGGDISFTYDKEVNVKSRLNFDGDLKLGEPFESGRKNIHISSGSLDIGKGGIIGGDIKNIDLNSMIKIGAYSVTLKRAELILGEKGGKQDALLKAAAELHLSGGRTVAGSASIDLMTGKIEKYEFQLDKPFQWKIPHDKPVMVFNVDKAKINQDGFFVDGRGSLNISGTKIPTVFDNLVLDPKTYEVKKGKIIINKDFAFEAGINEKTNGLSFKPVANGSGFDLNPGLFMALNGTIIIDTLGLHSSGSAGAKINFKSYKIDSLKAVYSNDFVLGLKPFGVKKGEADFYWKEQKVAYADPSGFHADFSYFGKKLLPDRLPLPVESFAYIQLRKNKKLLVNYKRQNDGTVKIFTKKNQPVDIVFPGLKGNTSAAPVIHTSFNNVVINPSTGQFISGKISADVSNSNPISDLSRFGIPLILKNVSFGKQVINGVSVPAMAMKGGFKLFNNKFGQNGNVTFYVQNDGRVKGNVSLKNISASVPLMANNLVALKIDSVDGSVDVPVISGGSPSIDLALGGEFRLLNTSGDNIAEAYISLRYDRNGLTLTHFSGAGNTSAAQFKLKGLGLEINKINNLTLGYNKNTGFDFDAGLDFKININTGKNKISIPLKNIDINKKLGIVIPDQDINQSTHPSFPENSTAFDIGIYHFQPFAMRIQSDTLNWNDLSANSAGNLLPKFDMQLSFPSLKNSSGELANATITLNNVGFGDGVFTGTVQPYTFRGNGALLSTGGGSGIYVKSISGGLLKNKDGSQGYNIKLSGSFKLPDYFVNKNGGCGNSVSVELSPDGGLTGSVSNFTPCGNIKLNSLVLTFRKSNLQFSIKGKNQEIVLAGKAAASFK